MASNQTEHVCKHPISSHSGSPVRAACGHFSAAVLELDDGQRICHDCASDAIRSLLGARRLADAILKTANGYSDHVREVHCAVCDHHMSDDDRQAFGSHRFAHPTCAMAAAVGRKPS